MISSNPTTIQPLFVSIDGVDGAGKTDTAKLVAEKIGAYYYKCPAEPFASVRHIVDNNIDPLTRYYFYMAVNQNDSRKIKEILDNGEHVVCDRYYHSTVAYHAVMDNRVEKIFSPIGLVKPDLPVLLFASSEGRQKRLQARENIKDLEQNSVYQDKVQDYLRNFDVLEIDTELNDQEAVANRVITRLKKIQPGLVVLS